ncbi:polyprenyl synthetase family protein [Georgenia yuyongxinii]|uniref:Polyprenyl synthetase family protein n=1 Tax=Georgenia yuyongxinii TaxID=2589797 RepID=A0A552WWS0_9MICO|nr:polyprenyl synthetase family protein [Georgenia yuyongxinii]TRW47156.1 polyprenyl synthetase family protein [Georgenia yuyongxinii]
MPSSPADVRDRVSERVLVALAEHTEHFAPVGALTDFLAPARDLLGGGKRLRAQLCAAGWVAAGGATEEDGLVPVVLAGSALELFQGTALVHDDVIDGSLTRRGLPAAHRRFAAEHAQHAWLGSPDDYGLAAAIVLGDLLLAVSAMEMERARALVPPAAGSRARAIYDLMTAEVALGQYLDIRSQDMPWGDDATAAVDRALQVVRHKSARYSVEHPLLLGAALAGAGEDQLGELSAVGLPLGEAFQLRDDELGVFGDPAVTGKPAGDDLREGKRTVLLAMTMTRSGPAERDLLRAQVGQPDLSGAAVAQIQQLMKDGGAFDAHEAMIEERRDAGLEALGRTALDDGARQLLEELATALTTRIA